MILHIYFSALSALTLKYLNSYPDLLVAMTRKKSRSCCFFKYLLDKYFKYLSHAKARKKDTTSNEQKIIILTKKSQQNMQRTAMYVPLGKWQFGGNVDLGLVSRDNNLGADLTSLAAMDLDSRSQVFLEVGSINDLILYRGGQVNGELGNGLLGSLLGNSLLWEQKEKKESAGTEKKTQTK